MLLDRRVEGLIVLANWLFVNIEVLGDLEKSNIPTVMIGRELKNDSISSVIVDNELGAYTAVEHLYSLGHRKIAFIRGPKALPTVRPAGRESVPSPKPRPGIGSAAWLSTLPESRDPISSFEAGYKLTEDRCSKRSVPSPR